MNSKAQIGQAWKSAAEGVDAKESQRITASHPPIGRRPPNRRPRTTTRPVTRSDPRHIFNHLR
jgi:hypothetical protein